MPPVARRPPSGENLAVMTSPSWPLSSPVILANLTSHNRTVPLPCGVAMRLPSGENPGQPDDEAWPTREAVFRRDATSHRDSSAGVPTAYGYPAIDTSVLPSGLKATAVTPPECLPRVPASVRVATSHKCTSLGSIAVVASSVPSGEKATQ